MTKLYHFEGLLYKRKKDVERATKFYISKKYDVIETPKPFNAFEEAFDELREQGCSIVEALDLAQ